MLFTLLQTFTPSVKFGNIPPTTQISTPEAAGQLLKTYISEIYTFGIGAGAFLAVVMIMWGGFLYITASGMSAQAEKGKHAIQMAFLGLIILFTSYIMLQTINPAILTLKFPNIDPIPKSKKVLETVRLPSVPIGFGEPDSGVAFNHGACVLPQPNNTDLACIENTTEQACKTRFAFDGTWFPHLACSNDAVKNLGTQTTPVSRRGRCIVRTATRLECYSDIPNSLCPFTTTSTWQEGSCDEVPKFVGACWEPDLTSLIWLCGAKTEINCLQASFTSQLSKRARFCGGNTTCTSALAREPSC